MRVDHEAAYAALKRVGDGTGADTSLTTNELELVWWLLERLQDKLTDLAPDGLHWGSAPGDGASFGWWPNEGGL